MFQLNWDDVNAAAGDSRAAGHQPWHPYQGNAEAAARGTYAQLGGDPAELPGLIWTTPVRTLFAFLSDPDRAAWSRRAQAAVAGLLRQPGAEPRSAQIRTVFAERVDWLCPRRAACPGRRRPGHAGPRRGRERLPGHGASSTRAAGRRETAPLGTWSALAVIDDRRATILADEEAHERRWAAWLYWGNLIQFLDDGGGDGVQLAWTGLDDFDPSVLAAAGGAGPGGIAHAGSGPRRSARRSCPCWARCGRRRSPGVAVDHAVGRRSYDLLAPEVEVLMHALAERGVPAPQPDQIGYELGDAGVAG